MVEIPADATPADIIGATDILPGQSWLIRSQLLLFANFMEQGVFPWHDMQRKEPTRLLACAIRPHLGRSYLGS